MNSGGWYWCPACEQTGDPTLDGHCRHCDRPVPATLAATVTHCPTVAAAGGVQLTVRRDGHTVTQILTDADLQATSDPIPVRRALVDMQQRLHKAVSDLVAWFCAQLDIDERAARDASPGGWTYGDVESIAGGSLYDKTRMIGSVRCEQRTDHDGRIVRHLLAREADANGRHIVRHDPERVLRQVEALRRIAHAHNRDHECTQLTGSGDHSVVDGKPWELWEDAHTESTGGYCLTLRLLASMYADRDGYLEEWKP